MCSARPDALWSPGPVRLPPDYLLWNRGEKHGSLTEQEITTCMLDRPLRDGFELTSCEGDCHVVCFAGVDVSGRKGVGSRAS